MRSIHVVLGLALLCACNVVTTKTPLFTQADATGAPQLRPGIWSSNTDADCKFAPSRPLAKWPACADGFSVAPGEVGSYDTDAHNRRTWKTAPYVLVAGDPAVLQVKSTEADASGGSAGDVVYLYLAVRPAKTDAAGRVTAYTGWLVLCGPPPPADAKGPDGKSARYGTLEPIAGMVMDDKGEDCATTSPQALHAAAAASEILTGPNSHVGAHWVRDGAR